MVEEGLMQRRTLGKVAWRPLIGVAAAAVLMGGCSSVPDAVNPVKWYESTAELFSDSDSEADEAAAKAQPAPGAEGDFPNIASVPDRPVVASEAERQRVAEGLVADRDKRRYASAVEYQGAPANALAPKAAPVAASDVQDLQPVPTMAPAPRPEPPVVRAPIPTPETPALRPQQVAAAQQTAPATEAEDTAQPAPLEPPAMPATVAPPAPRPASPMMATPSAPPMPTTPLPATPVAPRIAQPVPPAMVPMPSSNEPFPTVVVSSSGVDTGSTDSAAGAATQPAAPEFRTAQLGAASIRSGDTGQSLRVATIQFATGSANLDARDRTILKQVVALQRERGGVLRVVGHASAHTSNMDPVRHKMVNYEVSADRAEAVARILRQLGAPADRVVVVAKADSEPVFYEFMPSGEAGNRRAEIYLDF